MKILVLRSGASDADVETPQKADVVVLMTHEIVPRGEGIEEAMAFPAEGATLVVSSRVTVRVFLEGKKGEFFRRDFALAIGAGSETSEAMEMAREGSEDDARGRGRAGPPVMVADPPGAPGILSFLSRFSLSGRRILWPRGSDASDEPLSILRRAGAEVAAPIVYEKRPRSPASFSSLEESSLRAFRSGEFAAVAVGSMSALDVFLGAIGHPPAPLPQVRWGVLGPETARLFEVRGLPRPVVPLRPRLTDLIALLRSESKP